MSELKPELVPIGEEVLAKELYEVCCYPDPTTWEELDDNDKSIWRTRSAILCERFGQPKKLGREEIAKIIKKSYVYKDNSHVSSYEVDMLADAIVDAMEKLTKREE